ncbi:MAG TPA: hypothetical protein VF092_23910 [Longimicrobium sp.]
MKASTKAALVIGAGLLFAVWCARDPLRTQLRMQWMRMHGAVVPVGSGTAFFQGEPVRLLTVEGVRAGSRLSGQANLAAYHVMLVFPGADSVSDVLTSSGGNELTHTAVYQVQAWRGPHGVNRPLTSKYDAVTQRVWIEERSYALSHGNLFVARFDEQGHLAVRQLAGTLTAISPRCALRAFQQLVPSDPVIAHVAQPAIACARRPTPAGRA